MSEHTYCSVSLSPQGRVICIREAKCYREAQQSCEERAKANCKAHLGDRLERVQADGYDDYNVRGELLYKFRVMRSSDAEKLWREKGSGVPDIAGRGVG